LSDRIMTRYGNTPEGMAVSAIEFMKIFRDEGFDSIVVSMKSSDTRVMVDSNRRLVSMMEDEGMHYPVHLGITEAGEGDDGRIISAAGSGTLLAEGIGDTLRVSLSEAPENEIPVAREIIHAIAGEAGRVREPVSPLSSRHSNERYKPQVYIEREGSFLDEQGEAFEGRVITVAPKELLRIIDANQIADSALGKVPGVNDAALNPNPGKNASERIADAVLNPVFSEDDAEKLVIDAAALLGRFFIARQPAGLCISNRGAVQGDALRKLAFAILQATEARITRTRYISCPTCGRTKFNLEEAVRKVKAATAHLSGMKIAVMGCIVNGPGEMAGADYGYVGAAEGRVHIYRGTEAVIKNVPEDEALRSLLELIEKDQASR
ncbi:MAG: flavodoxin-dependent (E)-4-hydroxy-3-methylbut-2-enyl-diphosphate synthase, partial [bacterium]